MSCEINLADAQIGALLVCFAACDSLVLYCGADDAETRRVDQWVGKDPATWSARVDKDEVREQEQRQCTHEARGGR
jgi:hypothetical protein